VGNIALWMQVSLDGFAEGPDRDIDWPIVDEELWESYLDELSAMDVFLYGREMYEIMASFWPTADADPAISDFYVRFARLWKRIPKTVFSGTSLEAVSSNTVVRDNVIEEVRAIKASRRNAVLFGGVDIASLLIKQDLIDDYHIFIHPVLLGGGSPLFPVVRNRSDLTLVDTRTFETSVVHMHYRRAAARESARTGGMKMAG
jgi:dihydrofolate reductase